MHDELMKHQFCASVLGWKWMEVEGLHFTFYCQQLQNSEKCCDNFCAIDFLSVFSACACVEMDLLNETILMAISNHLIPL